MRTDTLILFAEGPGIPLVIDFSSIKNLEVNKNKRTVAAPGAIAGFVVGGITGVIIGLSAFEDDCPDDCTPPADWPEDVHYDCSDDFCVGFSRSQKTIALTLLSSTVGAAAGYLIGGLIKLESWEKVPIDQIRLGIDVDSHDKKRLALNLSLHF